MNKRIIIIGAGPTGLGAAYRLQQIGYKNWVIYEKNDYVGGLAASFKDDRGFTWDIGGHVIFSNYAYFNQLVNTFLENDYLEHNRESWIRFSDAWVPYPFQNNIRYLRKEQIIECIMGLIEAQAAVRKPANFEEWILCNFGKAIADYFMLPYNRKIWAWPLDLMDNNWVEHRVSPVNIRQILKTVISDKADTNWGPNVKFRFPRSGGTGGLFKKFQPYICDKLVLQEKLNRVNLKEKLAYFTSGRTENYDILVNSSALDSFVSKIEDVPEVIRKAGDSLASNSIYVTGIGLKQKLASPKSWIYSPDADCPFYRVTYFSGYSPHNVPFADTQTYCSYMCETAFSKFRNIDKKTIIEQTIAGLIKLGILNEADRKSIVSTYLIDVPKAYPIPTSGRDEALSLIQPFLHNNGIFSRGRFGAWRYEIGNMDHSVMQGVELIDHLLQNKDEKTFLKDEQSTKNCCGYCYA